MSRPCAVTVARHNYSLRALVSATVPRRLGADADVLERELLQELRRLFRSRTRPSIEAHRTPVFEEALCGLSMRALFSIFLTALRRLRPGQDTLLCTPFLYHSFGRILEAHDYQVELLDAVRVGSLSFDVSLGTRSDIAAILIFHAFGGQLDTARLHSEALRLGIPTFEDIVQGSSFTEHTGSADATVVGTSFGQDKSPSAIGGGAVLVRDGALHREMKSILAGLPRQSRTHWTRYAVKKLPLWAVQNSRPIHTAMDRALRANGSNTLEGLRWMRRNYSGFPKDPADYMMRPHPQALAAMLAAVRNHARWRALAATSARRWAVFEQELGQELCEAYFPWYRPGGGVAPPASGGFSNLYYHVLTRDLSAYLERMVDEGFSTIEQQSWVADATQAPHAHATLSRLALLPSITAMTSSETTRLIAVLEDLAR